jgi:hypothetical protein
MVMQTCCIVTPYFATAQDALHAAIVKRDDGDGASCEIACDAGRLRSARGRVRATRDETGDLLQNAVKRKMPQAGVHLR